MDFLRYNLKDDTRENTVRKKVSFKTWAKNLRLLFFAKNKSTTIKNFFGLDFLKGEVYPGFRYNMHEIFSAYCLNTEVNALHCSKDAKGK